MQYCGLMLQDYSLGHDCCTRIHRLVDIKKLDPSLLFRVDNIFVLTDKSQ
jgi:hypothetical protein